MKNILSAYKFISTYFILNRIKKDEMICNKEKEVNYILSYSINYILSYFTSYQKYVYIYTLVC